MINKEKIKSILSCLASKKPPKHRAPTIEFKEFIALNAIACRIPDYLYGIFEKAATRNHNVVFFGHAIDALSITTDYCVKNHVPLHIVNMKCPSCITEQQKEHVLSRTKDHERYDTILTDTIDANKMFDTQNLYDCVVLNILDNITQHPMRDAKQHILVIQHFHKHESPKWVYNFLCDVTWSNRFCYGSVLFLDSSFD